ncbi:MAG: DUF2807 domain-containing protein [Sphingobium sp.]|nr:DUF2807 domain-containing protein [Sphingobium sp.]
MGDKMRLMVTGVAAAGVLAVTVSGHSLWSMFDDDRDPSPAQAVPLSQLRDFDGITLQGPDAVVVTSGPQFSIKTEGNPEALKYLTLSVHNGVLRVGRRQRNGWWGASGDPVTVHVTMPGLSRVWITGSGDVTVDKVGSKEFSSRLDGSGGLTVGAIASNAVRLSLNGSGHMDLDGTARDVSISLVGSGEVSADGLTAQTADISVAGSGEIVAHAANNAKLTLNGSGHAQVAGTNRCEIHKAGSGEAECTS